MRRFNDSPMIGPSILPILIAVPLAITGCPPGGGSGSGSGNGGGGGSENGNSSGQGSQSAVVAIPPATSAYAGEQVTVRIDLEALPDNDSITGFTIDICDGDPADASSQCGMGEQGAGIDIRTAACSAGAGSAFCEEWSITPSSDSDSHTYYVVIDAVGAYSPISCHVLPIAILYPTNVKPFYLYYSTQFDANELYLTHYGEGGVKVQELISSDLTDLHPPPTMEGSGPCYDVVLDMNLAQRHDPLEDPDPTPYYNFDYIRERLGCAEACYYDDPLSTSSFAVGVNELGTGYKLLRETMFIFNDSSRFEQIYLGPGDELYYARPGTTEAQAHLLDDLLSRGYSLYDGVEFDLTCAFSVSGEITGLTGAVVLENGSDYLSRSNNGAFKFHHPVAEGETYDVQIYDQPLGQECTVTNGAGTVGASDVVNIVVECGDTSDNCPDDPDKLEPGVCGCGTPDTDSDSDGTPDCMETETCADVAGVWNLVNTGITSTCGSEGNWNDILTISQSGCVLTVDGLKGATGLSGSVSGDTVTIGPHGFSEDGGTTTSTFTMTLSSADAMEGNESWTWMGNGGGRCDDGTGSVTATRQ